MGLLYSLSQNREEAVDESSHARHKVSEGQPIAVWSLFRGAVVTIEDWRVPVGDAEVIVEDICEPTELYSGPNIANDANKSGPFGTYRRIPSKFQIVVKS